MKRRVIKKQARRSSRMLQTYLRQRRGWHLLLLVDWAESSVPIKFGPEQGGPDAGGPRTGAIG